MEVLQNIMQKLVIIFINMIFHGIHVGVRTVLKSDYCFSQPYSVILSAIGCGTDEKYCCHLVQNVPMCCHMSSFE